MKIAPRENRSMFIAAISGLAGICGGLGAMAGGAFLHACSGFEITLLGRVWNNYHLLFAVNFFMRAACIVLAYRVREPGSSAPEDVLDELGDSWAVRFLLFPAGLYRRLGLQWEDDQADHPS
jgi:hypothetical protein